MAAKPKMFDSGTKMQYYIGPTGATDFRINYYVEFERR